MAPDPTPSNLGEAVQDVTEKVQLLVREEIALAKAELSEKVSKLIKGAVIGIVGGVFALLGLLNLLDAASWGVWQLISDSPNYWLGFLIVAVVFFVIGAIAAFVASKLIKKASPPTPKMAIEEAQLIRQTISSPPKSEVQR